MSISGTDKAQIEVIVRNEIKQFLNTTQAHNIVLGIIQRELGGKKINDKMVDLASKVVVELFKTLWQRKSFWEGAIKSVR